MWMSGQHKRPADEGEGQTGIVTMSGGETAVLLDRERRGLQVYSPAGYCWTPKVGQRVLVIKPQTYMNLSGEAVKLAGGFYKIPQDRVLVISDDVALPLGKLRIRAGGSAGGHNGLKNIIAHLGTDQFPRVRVGVGAPEHPAHEMIDWVIGHFTAKEKKVVDEAVGRAVDAALCVMEKGVQEAQNRFN